MGAWGGGRGAVERRQRRPGVGTEGAAAVQPVKGRLRMTVGAGAGEGRRRTAVNWMVWLLPRLVRGRG